MEHLLPFELKTSILTFLVSVYLHVSSLQVAHLSVAPPPPPPGGYLLWRTVPGYRTKLLRAPPGSLRWSAYSTVIWELGLKSSKRQLEPVRLISPEIEPATPSFQFNRSTK